MFACTKTILCHSPSLSPSIYIHTHVHIYTYLQYIYIQTHIYIINVRVYMYGYEYICVCVSKYVENMYKCVFRRRASRAPKFPALCQVAATAAARSMRDGASLLQSAAATEFPSVGAPELVHHRGDRCICIYIDMYV